MAGIRMHQRHAIEALANHLSPLYIPYVDVKYYLGEKEIFLLGISECVGTCGELKDVNFAVFGETPNDFQLEQPIEVAGSVLLRYSTEEEQQKHNSKALWVVEGLYLSMHCLIAVCLQRVGVQKEYVATIC